MPINNLTSVPAQNATQTTNTARPAAASLSGLSPAGVLSQPLSDRDVLSQPLLGEGPAPALSATENSPPNGGLRAELGYDMLHGPLADEITVIGEVMQVGNALLWESPASHKEAADMQNRIDLQTDLLQGLKENITAAAKDFAPELTASIDDMITELSARKEYLNSFKDSDATTKTAIAQTRKGWVEGALKWAKENLPADHPETQRTISMLENRAAAFNTVDDSTPYVDSAESLSPAELEKAYQQGIQSAAGRKKLNREGKALEKRELTQQVSSGNIPLFGGSATEPRVMAAVLKHACQETGVSAKDIGFSLKHAHQEVMGEQMTTINKQIPIQTAHGTVTFDSQMVPAKEFGESGVAHNFGEKGIACHQSTESEHAKNLWTSSLTTPDGRQIFSGVRHGVHSAYGFNAKDLRKLPDAEVRQKVETLLKPEQCIQKNGQPDYDATVKACRSFFSIKGMRLRKSMRTEANNHRAKEALAAALKNNPEVLRAAQSGENPTLTVSSLSLLTPDALRAAGGVFGMDDNNERRMLADQLSALRSAAAEGLDITVMDEDGSEQTVHIPVELRTFNFGVNMGALTRLGKLIAPSWSHANAKANNEAIRSLIGPNRTGDFGGDVQKFLQRENVHEDAKNDVRALAGQIRDLWNDGTYKQDNSDPYAIGARIAVLSNRLGQSLTYNCKSGKDRTGELDAEAKYLAIRMELDGEVPAPGALSDNEKAMFRSVALSSGNLEVQKVNTGAGGYKLEGIKGIIARLGSMQAKLMHRGQSKFVAS